MYRHQGQRLGYWRSHTVTDEEWLLFRKRFRKHSSWHKKFAWIPHYVQGKIIWLSDFYERHNHHYFDGKLDTIRIECYTKEYYIGKKLMGEL